MQDPTQMDDPENPFKKHRVQSAQTSSTNPFKRHTTAMPSPQVATPVGEPVTMGDEMQRVTHPSELAALESQDIAGQREKILELLKRPDLTPGHRARLEKLAAQWSTDTVAGIEMTNRVTDPNRPAISNLARGAAAGAINYGLGTPIDLTMAVAQMALPKYFERLVGLPEGRKAIADWQTHIREDLDPQGWWGTGGTVAGSLIGGLKPWQILNSTGFKALSQIPRVGPWAAGIVFKGTSVGATYLERLAANALGSGAVDAVQLADILTEEGRWQDKAVALFATAAMSGGSALAFSMRPVKPGSKPAVEDPNAPKGALSLQPKEGEVDPIRAVEADAKAKKAAEQADATARRLKVNRLAKDTWEAQNPGKSFKDDLSKTEREAWMKSFREKFEIKDEPTPDTNLDTSQQDLFDAQQGGVPAAPGEVAPGKVPAGDETGIPSGADESAPRVEPEFEGDARELPRTGSKFSRAGGVSDPKALIELRKKLEIEAMNPQKFSLFHTKEIYNRLIPRHRFELFDTNAKWEDLEPSQRIEIMKKMTPHVDEFKAKFAEKEVDYQLNRVKYIDDAERLYDNAISEGDYAKARNAQVALAYLESAKGETNYDALLTYIVDDITQDMPKEVITDVIRSILNGEMPRHSVFAGDRAVKWLLKMGAKYDPKWKTKTTPKPAATAEPSTTKPEPAPTQPAEPRSPDTTNPSPTPPPEVEQLRQENTRLRVERDEAIRARDVDSVTGYGNKDAFERARPSADADPNVEITYFDMTNFKYLNDNTSTDIADAELKRIGQSIETVMHSMGLIGEPSAANPNPAVRIFRQGDEFFVIHERGRSAELIKKAIELAGVKEIDGPDGKYPVRLRGASGKTFEEANLAVNAMKAAEAEPTKAPRRRTKKTGEPKQEIDFHGEKLKKPLDEMSEGQLDALTDKFDAQLAKGEITDGEYEQILKEIAHADRVRNARAEGKPLPEMPAKPSEELPPDVSIARPVTKGKLPEDAKPPVDPKVQLARAEKSKSLFRRPLEKMTDADLLWHRDDVASRMNSMSDIERKTSGYADRMAKINEEIAGRNKLRGPGDGTLLMHPAITGGVTGFFSSYIMPIDDESERLDRALAWGAMGAAGGMYLRRMQKRMQDAVPEYQKNIRKQVKSVEDAPLERRVGPFTFLSRLYGNVARRDIGITHVSSLVESKGMPASKSAGKMAEIFGLWRGMTDQWIHGDRISYFTNEGQEVILDAMPLNKIAQMVNGDMRTVGDLAAAHRELTLRGLEYPRTTGLSITDATNMYKNTPEIYHKAANELSKLFRAMRDMSVASGLLSKEAATKMDEQGFYVAIRRLFDNEPGTSPSTISTKSRGGSKTMGPENQFKYLKGSKLPYQNPVEALIDLLPRYMRAAELNRLAVTFFDEVAQLSPADRRLVGKRLQGPDIPELTPEQKVKVKALRKNLWEEGGMTITERQAEAVLQSISDESLNITNDKIRFYRDGELEVWQVSDPIARAFRAMQPHDLAAFLEAAGILTKPTNIARVGITANPVFVGWQAFRDIWQFHQNGGYAPPPSAPLGERLIGSVTSLPKSALGSVRGWLGLMLHSPEAKMYWQAGAGGESVASQGLRVARGDIKHSTDLLNRIKQPPVKNQFEKIAREAKQLNFREAYAAIMQPIADAGRFGAYLHERGRGSNVIEAIYRSKKVGANFGNRGDATMIQALNRMTLFLNPAIQSMDATRHAFQRDPIGYIARGVAGTSAISALLWAAYEDDEEIKQLRATPYGSKFWWFRVAGNIVKVPKPIFDGQVFGTPVEAWLDHKKDGDPIAYRRWVESMWNDAAVNLLPFVGVVPISLATGKIVGLGTDVIPKGTEQLDPEFRARPNSTSLARIAAEKTRGVARAVDTRFTDNLLSPAGLDFVISQYLGGLGSEMSRAISTAYDAQQVNNDLPPKEELPFIRQLFGSYPSMGVQAINEFYTFAERADRASATATYLASSNPERLLDYMVERQSDLMTSKLYAEGRAELADLRKAIEDVRQAPPEVMNAADKRELIQVFMRQMIDIARANNDAARLMREAATMATGK